MLARLWWLSELQFSIILSNFEILGGVDPRKINMGFEAGEQAAGGIWEGEERDEEATRDIVRRNSGGAMIWAVNPNSVQHPQASKLCPILAKGHGQNLPEWIFGELSCFHVLSMRVNQIKFRVGFGLWIL